MRPAGTWGCMRRSALGRYLVAPSFVAWSSAPDFIGVTLAGAPLSELDVDRLFSLWDDPPPSDLADRYDCLLDAGAGPQSDAAVVRRFLDGLARRGGSISGRVRRQAVVRRDTPFGVLLTGALDLMTPRAPSQVFLRRPDALAWLDRPEVEADAELADEVGVSLARRGPWITRMHAVLAASGPRLTVSAVARALALSPRSLQRYLRAAGTGFRKEIERALVELARDLLEQRELDLRAIAGRLGFSSADELTRFFRRSTGLTPAEWRDPEGTGAPIDERA